MKEIGNLESNLNKFKPIEPEPRDKSRIEFTEYLRSPRKIEPKPVETPKFSECGYSPKRISDYDRMLRDTSYMRSNNFMKSAQISKNSTCKQSMEITKIINKWGASTGIKKTDFDLESIHS